jgi:hypothetical protein
MTMARRYFICTGSESMPNAPKDVHVPIGIEVEADEITIETSGALTVWKRENEARATLIMGFGPLHWHTVHMVPAAAEGQSGD